MNLNEQQIELINLALDEAILHDFTIDPSLRSAKIFLEVYSIGQDGRVPIDRKVCLTLKHVSRIATSLIHYKDQKKFLRVEPFSIKDFEKIIRSFRALPIYGTKFISKSNNNLPPWFDKLSMDTIFDENSCDYMIDLFQDGNNRKLDFRIWFDELSVSGPTEEEISIDDFIAGGKRWWEAFNKNDPRTQGFGMFPLT